MSNFSKRTKLVYRSLWVLTALILGVGIASLDLQQAGTEDRPGSTGELAANLVDASASTSTSTAPAPDLTEAGTATDADASQTEVTKAESAQDAVWLTSPPSPAVYGALAIGLLTRADDGTTVTDIYEIKAISGTPLESLTLHSTLCPDPLLTNGDDNLDGRIDLNEVWLVSCRGERPANGEIEFVATARDAAATYQSRWSSRS